MRPSDSFLAKSTMGLLIAVVSSAILSKSIMVFLVGGLFSMYLLRTLVKGGSIGRED